ncbi:hypothetical protein A3860_17045 [Niastella vici]|uniref:Glycosyltransferase RgtA/B/C/D-like domain-containing protein n=1 Tax=Niastella vici TaxID=1703345 RepID=A0A1V9G434_9BACT|nr:hypothetical protein [Niastella vici]OQP65373.1 hypothetical protein A3860_17045 [Niastella vici]
MLFEQPISNLSFWQWLRMDQENKRLLWISAITILIQFIVFKAFYPLPNFMPPDSFYYLDAAYHNQTINFWAIGYSKFLRLFSSFTNSDLVLVIGQYLILEVSLLYFLFSVRYLTAPKIWTFRILLGISILNPLLTHISNFISSDGLFTALSLCWFTQLLFILYKPSLRLLLSHSLVLLLAFMVRYNAIYYPFISIGCILLAHMSQKIKWVGITALTLLLGGFIGRTQYEYYKMTGTVQYSAFGGWQLAANALYGYAHARPDATESIPPKFRTLHSIVNHHMDSLNKLFFIFRPDLDIGVYYLWDGKSPLKVYLAKHRPNDTLTPYFNRWAAVAPLYASYGRYIIFHHPRTFLKYFVWSNFVKYYVPPAGFMEDYNGGEDVVAPIASTWFGWKDNKIYNNFGNKKIRIAKAFPLILAMSNFIFVISFIGFTGLGGFKKCSVQSRRILFLTLIVWGSNMIFSVLSAPIELRYQLFPMVLTCTILFLLLSFIVSESRAGNADQKMDHGNDQNKTPSIQII